MTSSPLCPAYPPPFSLPSSLSPSPASHCTISLDPKLLVLRFPSCSRVSFGPSLFIMLYVEASELLSLSLTYPSFFGLVFNLNLCQFSPRYFRLHQMSVVTCLIKWYYGEIFLSDTRYCSNHYRKRIKSIKHIL